MQRYARSAPRNNRKMDRYFFWGEWLCGGLRGVRGALRVGGGGLGLGEGKEFFLRLWVVGRRMWEPDFGIGLREIGILFAPKASTSFGRST
jgi:hypothetical protein